MPLAGSGLFRSCWSPSPAGRAAHDHSGASLAVALAAASGGVVLAGSVYGAGAVRAVRGARRARGPPAPGRRDDGPAEHSSCSRWSWPSSCSACRVDRLRAGLGARARGQRVLSCGAPPARRPPARRGQTVEGREHRAGCVALVLAGCATGAGHANREGATDPVRRRWRTLDPARVRAYWVSPRPPRSDWSRSLLSRGPAAPDVAPVWTAGDPTDGPAPAAELPAPVVVVVADRTDAGVQHLTLRVPRRRGVPRRWGSTSAAPDVRRAGRRGPRRPRTRAVGTLERFGFLFHDAPADGVTVGPRPPGRRPRRPRSGPAFPAPQRAGYW